MFGFIRHSARDEKRLQETFHDLRVATEEVVSAKHRLDETIAHNHNQDQFRAFAERARRSKF